MPKRPVHQRAKRSVTIVTLLTLLLQVFVPVGYMPASLASDGALVQLCPTGLSDELMQLLHTGHELHSLALETGDLAHNGHGHHGHYDGHHGHHAHHASSHEKGSQKSLGSGLEVGHSSDKVQHTSAMDWEAPCPYGAASSGTDLFVALPTIQIKLSQQRCWLINAEAQVELAQRFRQQAQRAPPQLDS